MLLKNLGGEGVAHATVLVPLTATRASGAAANVLCGRSIPDTPGGDYADLACSFDLPPGETIGNFPSVKSIDYAAAVSRSSAGPDLSGIAIAVMAGATLLLAVALLIITLGRRPSESSERAVAASSSGAPVEPSIPPAKPRSKKRDDPDAEYNLPQLPR